MSTGLGIKKIREQKELTQQTIADFIAMHRSNYSKIKNGQRELSIDALKKIVKYFGIATDQFINYGNGIPTEVTTENKTILEQVKLIQGLEPEEKNMAFKMVDTFLTQKKFKDFFQKNIATL